MSGRRLLVDQRESDAGQFWYVLRGGNGQVLSTSEMYPTRDGALRAARRFIALIAPVPVTFTYSTGNRPPITDPNLLPPKRVTERVR